MARLLSQGRRQRTRPRVHHFDGAAHQRGERSPVRRVRLGRQGVDRSRRAHEGQEKLAPRAVAMVKEMAATKLNAFVFPGIKRGEPLSDMAMLMLLRSIRPGVTVHGFRSSFRDWAAELTAFPREVAEVALAHKTRSALEAAYQRGDLFDKRRELMNAWAAIASRHRSEKRVAHIAKASRLQGETRTGRTPRQSNRSVTSSPMPRLNFIRPLSPSAAVRPPKGRRLAARTQVGWLSLPGHQRRRRCAALL